MQKRILNYRPTWNFSENLEDSNENITGNYYPVQAGILLESLDNRVMFISNDRSQAGSSLEPGSIEFM
jgi:hypothetical protein